MKKTIILGQYEKLNERTQKKALGDLVVEVMDVPREEWKNQKTKLTNNSLSAPETINQMIANFGSGSRQLSLIHPISQQPFILDLTPWDNIDGERYLRIDYGWVRKS